MRFRNKPLEVDAIQVHTVLWLAQREWTKLPAWVRASYEQGTLLLGSFNVRVESPNGWDICDSSDWLIRDGAGRIRGCACAEFEASYEPIPDAPVSEAQQ